MSNTDINKLVTDNMGYVKSLANQFTGRGVEYDDLVGEGYIAMTQAAQKFDTSRGTQFVAYAAPIIRKAMEQAVKQTVKTHDAPQSIDAPLTAGNKYTLLDILVNQDALKDEEYAYFKIIRDDLQKAIASLNEREQLVVRKFFGIGTPHVTMADIAEDMQLKRERVRQIRNKAVRKMSRQAQTKALKTLLRK